MWLLLRQSQAAVSGKMQQHLPLATHLVSLFVGLSLDEGDGCFEDAQHQGAHTAGMGRDVASAAEVAGLQASQLLLSQLAQPTDTSTHMLHT